MTIKELSNILGVSRDLVEKRIKELYPGKMKKGVTTKLNQVEATAIKLRISQNSSIATSDDRRKLAEMPKTNLEKELIIQQALMLQQEKIITLQDEVAALKNIAIEQKPKADFYDAVTKTDKWLTMKEVADILNVPEFGRNNIYKILRDEKYLTRYNQPYQKYKNQKLFKSIESVKGHGSLRVSTVVSQKGLDRIRIVVSEYRDNKQKRIEDNLYKKSLRVE